VKIAVVVQGGGMRGVYSMAALDALAESKYADDIKYIVGSSAGAINASYYISKRTKQAVDFYVRYLSNKDFVNFLRLKKIVDIDFMVDTLKAKNPLEIDLLEKSKIVFDIMLTDAETGAPFQYRNDGKADIYELIRATSALPLLYGKIVDIEGEGYVDGGVATPIPFQDELIEEYDLTIVILTKDICARPKEMGFLMRKAYKLFLSKYNDALVEEIIERNGESNIMMDYLQNKADKSKVLVCHPSDMSKMVKRTTANQSKLEVCAKMGYDDMCSVLNHI
jgi:predicted patatin/cPLA2 family phospholipase